MGHVDRHRPSDGDWRTRNKHVPQIDVPTCQGRAFDIRRARHRSDVQPSCILNTASMILELRFQAALAVLQEAAAQETTSPRGQRWSQKPLLGVDPVETNSVCSTGSVLELSEY